MSEKLPDILYLTGLNAVVTETGELHSPRLSELVTKYKHLEGDMWTAFENCEPGSIEELQEGNRLAEYYMLRTAFDLQYTARDKELWTERFNQRSIELYGEIDHAEVNKIAANEVAQYRTAGFDKIADIYETLSGGVTAEVEDSEHDLSEFKNEILNRFPAIIKAIPKLPETEITSGQIRVAFEEIRQSFTEESPEWNNWKISNSEGKTMLNINAVTKEIDVPDSREPVSNILMLLGLALHEYGVHAIRGANGYILDDNNLAVGLQGYVEFEEGLGVLFEYLVTGSLPLKNIDRYIDIALATGAVDGIYMSRYDLIEFGVARANARNVINGQPAEDPNKVMKNVTNHVNRIFRGGDGKPIRDDEGNIINQPVFVKDHVYHTGFLKARDYVVEQLEAGKTPKQILDYLLAGKFDPTITSHVNYLRDKHGITL